MGCWRRDRTWQGSNWLWRGTRKKLHQRDGFRCVYCLSNEETLSIDHVDPTRPGRSKRGDNSPANLLTACLPCNRRKGRRSLNEWARVLARLTGQDATAIVARVNEKLATPLPASAKQTRMTMGGIA